MRTLRSFSLLGLGILPLLTWVGCGNGSGTLTLHSTGNYSAASLKGSYVYQIHGTTVSGPYRELGVFTADGAGNITSGTDDFDAGAISSSSPTGSYQVSSDGTGFIALNSTGLGQNNGAAQITLAITLVSSSKVNLIEADAFAEAAGVAELQTATTIPAGPFVFRSHQIAFNSSQSPVAEVGAINISNGAVTGNLDQNLGGTSSQLTLTAGTLGTPAAAGRGTGSFTDSANVTTNFVYYIVSSGKFVFMISTPGRVGSGSAEAQSGTVSNGLAGSYAFGSRGDVTTSYDSVATVGQMTVSSGAISSGTIESMQFGVYSSPLAITGTATPTPSTNGRVAVTYTSSAGTVQQVFWMVSPSRAFFLTNDPNTVEDGTADLQTSNSFTASTLNGQYSMVMDGIDFSGQQPPFLSRVGPLQFDGAGKATLNELTNNGSGATSPGGLTGVYQISSNGRVAVALGGGTLNFAMYAISGSDAYTLQIDGGENTSGMVNLQN